MTRLSRPPVNVGVLSLKGGVGKTILAVHLAHYLHEEGLPVVLIDAEAIHGSMNWHLRGNPFGFPVVKIQDYVPAKWKEHYQVFDTPAHPASKFLVDLVQVLHVGLVPVTINLDSQLAAQELVPYLKGEGLRTHTVINDAPDRSQPDAGLLHSYLQDMGLAPLDTIVRQRKAYEYARHEGAPVFACSHRARMLAWHDLYNLGRELYGTQPA